MEQERIREELLRITTVIEQLTGLHSRWSGVVELVYGATFRGKKPFNCDILIDAALIDADVRWRTLIHEALHACSSGFTRSDFAEHVGWEEGVIEMLQRLLRPTILASIAVTVDETVFREAENRHAFNDYINALEAIRLMDATAPNVFYMDLLKTPIRSRYAIFVQRAIRYGGDERRRRLEVLSAANLVLDGGMI